MDNEDIAHYEAAITRLAKIHGQLRGEERWFRAIDEEEIASMLHVALLPLEAALVETGRATVRLRAVVT